MVTQKALTRPETHTPARGIEAFMVMPALGVNTDE